MKTIFKSLFIAAFFVGAGTVVQGQGLGAQEDVQVTARILKQITLAKTDISFGTVQAGGGQTFLDPKRQDSTSLNIGLTATVGTLVIDATAEEPISVEFNTTLPMIGTGGSATSTDTITFKPIISAIRGLKTINATDRAASVLVSNTTIIAPITTVTEPGTGEGPRCLITTDSADSKATLYIGGYLYMKGTTTPITTAQPTGNYTGTLNFNLNYAL
jgi:hypothetical protein